MKKTHLTLSFTILIDHQEIVGNFSTFFFPDRIDLLHKMLLQIFAKTKCKFGICCAIVSKGQ